MRLHWLLVGLAFGLVGCRGEGEGAAAEASAAAAPAAASDARARAETAPTQAVARPSVVRVAAVNTTLSSGLLQELASEFSESSGLQVEFFGVEQANQKKKGRGNKLFEAARAGKIDLMVTHYGKPPLEAFVMEGLGEYPRLVFANQAAIIGPATDPAGIAGMSDAAAAFRKIAASGSPYVVNNLEGLKYLSGLLWRAAGEPDKNTWWMEPDQAKSRAVIAADEIDGYVLFGVQPFLHFKNKHGSTMRILVSDDPLLQRTMASVVVNPARVPGVNHAGARAFQRYLTSATAQIRVRDFRTQGSDQQFWWPMARSNDPADLAP